MGVRFGKLPTRTLVVTALSYSIKQGDCGKILSRGLTLTLALKSMNRSFKTQPDKPILQLWTQLLWLLMLYVNLIGPQHTQRFDCYLGMYLRRYFWMNLTFETVYFLKGTLSFLMWEGIIQFIDHLNWTKLPGVKNCLRLSRSGICLPLVCTQTPTRTYKSAFLLLKKGSTPLAVLSLKFADLD